MALWALLRILNDLDFAGRGRKDMAERGGRKEWEDGITMRVKR